MDAGKLKSIISSKNDQLERDALHQAEQIIGLITDHQRSIVNAQAAIIKLREQLAALNVEQLDEKAILGE